MGSGSTPQIASVWMPEDPSASVYLRTMLVSILTTVSLAKTLDCCLCGSGPWRSKRYNKDGVNARFTQAWYVSGCQRDELTLFLA